MQLILDTVPVIREEDRQELLKVMPSFVGQGWEVKRSLRELLPEVEDKGKQSICIFIFKYVILLCINSLYLHFRI